jgi:bacteriorhodopsin
MASGGRTNNRWKPAYESVVIGDRADAVPSYDTYHERRPAGRLNVGEIDRHDTGIVCRESVCKNRETTEGISWFRPLCSLGMATPTMGLEAISLWIGTIGMALGTVYFLAKGWSVDDPREQEYYIVTIFIPAIAAVSYFAMATGYGLIEVDVTGLGTLDIYWARYADWLFTTPLLLLDLGLLAGADRNTIYTLIGLDVFMIGTGLVGALATEGQLFRIVWWAISTGALLVLLYFLLGKLSEQAGRRSSEVGALFSQLRNLTLVLWLIYPLIWILGTEGGLAFVPLGVETAAFMVLDLAAKVGFGFLLLRSREVLELSGATPSAAATD